MSQLFNSAIVAQKQPSMHANEHGYTPTKLYFQKQMVGASLVAQWLRTCLPMQGTRVQALVWGDPTCRGATGPVSHNC